MKTMSILTFQKLSPLRTIKGLVDKSGASPTCKAFSDGEEKQPLVETSSLTGLKFELGKNMSLGCRAGNVLQS